jgi:hypothetical protein
LVRPLAGIIHGPAITAFTVQMIFPLAAEKTENPCGGKWPQSVTKGEGWTFANLAGRSPRIAVLYDWSALDRCCDEGAQ